FRFVGNTCRELCKVCKQETKDKLPNFVRHRSAYLEVQRPLSPGEHRPGRRAQTRQESTDQAGEHRPGRRAQTRQESTGQAGEHRPPG
ncbi:hypothetical protein ANANG_G00241320, partial [Anguilla anguilla]